MEARTLQVFLRVLYTVNNNPQYILAKSSSQVPAIACNEESVTNEPAYARAPLKACLAAVCDSSPELLQDPTRDFSLYVLDPLEAQPLPTGLAQPPHNTSSPRGVAVALGLMSWALESSNSTNVFVTGTIIPNASPALEVVCALRETKRMPKPMLHSYPPLALIPSQLPHPPYPFQTGAMTWSCNPHPQLDPRQTLTRSVDFPEVYIGPPRRARGRPEGSTSSKSKVKAQARDLSLPGPSSSDAVDSRQTVVKESKQKTKPRPPRPPPTYSPFICAPLTRNTETAAQEGDQTGLSVLNHPSHLKHEDLTSRSQNQSHVEPDCQPQSQLHPAHDLLVGLLSALSSGTSTGNTTPEQQAALTSALQGLLVANSNFIKPVAGELPANIGEKAPKDHRNNSAGDEHDDGDSDIVVLDSSTIDTTIFRKASARHPSTSDQYKDSSPLPASTPPSVQENTSVSSRTSTPSDAPGLILTVTADSEIPKRNFSGWDRNGDSPPDMPTTPTPSRTRKRKLDEYSQDRMHWSTPLSPPSPSPSVVRTSSSRRAVISNHTEPSPVGGPRSMSSPSARLPSMLASMRGVAASNLRFSGSLVPSIHEHEHVATEKKGNQAIALVSKSRGDHGITSDTSSLKRRRTLGEFMAEQEARRNLKPRKTSTSERKLEASTSALSRAAPPLPANSRPTPKYADSSPSRPLFRSDSMVSGFRPPVSTSQSGFMSSTAISNSVLSSTITLTSIGSSTSQAKNPFKNFVVPAWARTNTAMLPRLSEDALARQKAEQEAKKAQVSLRRRDAARTKRKQPHRADHPSKDSSDEDDETAASDTKRRSLLPLSSSPARNVSVPQPPTLPVFASDAVAPIASSPPRSQPVYPTVPSTPPKKPISLSGSGSRHTPGKPSSCSLFTPSGQDSMSLFTPSTPSVTRSLTRSRFTPRSPTAPRRAGGAKMSPRKGVLQTPRTPRRNENDRRTPRSLRADRHMLSGSPNLASRTPQTQAGMGTRTFLLPPPSPCAPRTLQRPRQVSGSMQIVPHDSGTLSQAPSPDAHSQKVQRKDYERKEADDTLGLNEAFVEHAVTPPSKCHPHEAIDVNSDGDADLADDAPSPLPPSSPLPASPLSSPGPIMYDNHALRDADGSRAMDAAWLLSDDGVDPTTAWFTESDAGAWLTETEAWLTDTEGEPLPTDSDGAWLSDSDVAFGNLASSLQNWLSDEADAEETDGEVGLGTRATGQDDIAFDSAAFRRACESLVGHGGRSVDVDGAPGGVATLGPAAPPSDTRLGRPIESDFWESIKPLMGEGALNDVGTAPGAVPDVQAMLDSLVGT